MGKGLLPNILPSLELSQIDVNFLVFEIIDLLGNIRHRLLLLADKSLEIPLPQLKFLVIFGLALELVSDFVLVLLPEALHIILDFDRQLLARLENSRPEGPVRLFVSPRFSAVLVHERELLVDLKDDLLDSDDFLFDLGELDSGVLDAHTGSLVLGLAF